MGQVRAHDWCETLMNGLALLNFEAKSSILCVEQMECATHAGREGAMQFRKGKDSGSDLEPDDESIMHFEMADLLPEHHLLALYPRFGTLALLSTQPGISHPLILAEQQFSAHEMHILYPLLRLYPHYCPHEVLLASFSFGTTSEAMVERCRVRLEEARFADLWDYEMRPMRAVLSRTRLKLRVLGIEISSILEIGYLLTCVPERPSPAP